MSTPTIEPLTDFSREPARQAMRAALDAVRKELGRDHPAIFDNRPQPAPGWFDSVNPAKKTQTIGRCARSSAEQAGRAVASAKRAFPGWRDTPAEARARLLHNAATVLRRRRFELAAWQVLECGKQWREADADLAEGIDFCEFYGHEMLRMATPRRRDVPGEDNSYSYKPRGVSVVIAPWNFPLAILCGMAAAAAVTGNTVIMKPAEQSSVVAAKLMEVFVEAGFPPGVFSFLPGVGEEVGPTLVQHPDTALIAFTGSLGVGLQINRQAAETPKGQWHVKRVIAEMGGKNAIIIDDDADFDEAIDGVIESAFGYQGQKCSACSRVLVPESRYEAFLERLVQATKSRTIGPAEDPGYYMGAVIDEEAFTRLQGVIGRGQREARVAYAGEVGGLASEGYYIAPHVFADVDPGSFLGQEEFFGPVLAVIRYRDLGHAPR